ncbi:MAG: ferrous iron transport protein B, partial [Bacteroidia bacterium]
MKIALVGNPNSGKTTLFNALTGMLQDVGNFPGVTVERKSGKFKHKDAIEGARVVDLPGTYSLDPRSLDEQITSQILHDKKDPDHPDRVVVVLDATRLKVGLYLAMQVIETGIPTTIVLNMADELENDHQLDVDLLSEGLGADVFLISAKRGIGVNGLKSHLANSQPKPSTIKWKLDSNGDPQRHKYIKELLRSYNGGLSDLKKSRINKADDILTHPILGVIIFFLILTTVFQAVFSWAELPMELIDMGFSKGADLLTQVLPESFLTSLFIDGIWAGLAGILIFIPQIAFLFFFISLMDESGYMARVSFLTDGLMRKMGLNGRSVVPLISGLACAVPAIMAARMIPDKRERFITIMVTPFMSCAARLPVYAIVIALVIPSERLFGIFHYQGLVMTTMYLIGIVASLGVAWVLSKTLPQTEEGALMLELPVYRWPSAKNLIQKVITKVSLFVFNAGKVILVISILLWLAASFGPGDSFEQIDQTYSGLVETGQLDSKEADLEIAKEHLEASYIGRL